MAGCASSPPAGESLSGGDCLLTNRLSGFEALDDRHVYLRERGDKHYLVTTRGACLDLRHAITVAVDSPTQRLCSRGFAKLVHRDGLSGPLQSCHIDTIEPVASKEHARAYVDQRNGRPSPQIEGKWEELPEE